jgi:hypothetical protein
MQTKELKHCNFDHTMNLHALLLFSQHIGSRVLCSFKAIATTSEEPVSDLQMTFADGHADLADVKGVTNCNLSQRRRGLKGPG